MFWRIRARKRPSWSEGPFRYYQNWSGRIDRSGARGGMTSHGWQLLLGFLGKLTHRFGSRSVIWDYPGPGASRSVGRSAIMTTEWLDIPSLAHYQASSDGRVRSVPRTLTNKLGHDRRWPGVVLTPWIDEDGYSHVGVSGRRHAVHGLVAEAFHGPRPKGLEVRHLNGDKSDNAPTNLDYGTGSQNTLDQVRHGVHHETRRVRCPWGHPLEPPNLVTCPSVGNRRICLACGRARSTARRARAQGAIVDFQVLSDAKYRQLLACPGPMDSRQRRIPPVMDGITFPRCRRRSR